MAIEIERKFLVADATVLQGRDGTFYRQGYLSVDPQRVVRVRRADDRGFVTIKGATGGIARAEFEYAIPPADADAMLDQLCLRPLIEKTRYVVEHDAMRWEVDVFAGVNSGLIVAEIELSSERQTFSTPAWLGREVSNDPRYANANLVRCPYADWRD